MGEFSRLLRRDVNAYRKDRKCFKIVRTSGLVVKEDTKLQNFDTYLAWPSSVLGFMDELSKPCERLKLPAVIRNTATDRNRTIVYDDPGN